MRRIAFVLLLGILAAGCDRGAPAGEQAALLPVRAVGPWPWVSSLVGYRGRLWFANSDRTRECPCADLYSLDPREGGVRYERHLFSQSVGRPAVQGGLLYWPFEDSRFHVGAAHVAVTDGRAWRLLTVDDEIPLVHATALAAEGEILWLATSNPGLRLFASRDGGASWAPRGAAAGRADGLRWVLRALPFAGRLYGVAIEGFGASGRRALARLDTPRAEPLPGLARRSEVLSARVHEGRLLAVVEEASGTGIWASAGARLEPLEPGPPQGRLRDLAADGDGRLWALSLESDGGHVWRRADTGRWTLAGRILEGTPAELEVVAGRPFVAGSLRGSGALWGAAGPGPSRPDAEPAAALPRARLSDGDWRERQAIARDALARPDAYFEGARGARAALLALARSAAPPEAFGPLLEVPFPGGSAPFLDPPLAVPMRQLGPWLALFAIAVSGRGHVPVTLLAEPWPERALGRNGKYFEPLLAALEAVAWNGQSDVATVDALIARLDAPGDPTWLRGDVVGALAAATGERHGYDVEAWRRWWREARSGSRSR